MKNNNLNNFENLGILRTGSHCQELFAICPKEDFLKYRDKIANVAEVSPPGDDFIRMHQNAKAALFFALKQIAIKIF